MTIGMKKIGGIVLASVLAVSVAACGGKNTETPSNNNTTAPKTEVLEGKVTGSGSTALLPLALAAKEQFEAKNNKVTVDLAGGGSGNGLSQVATGAVTIGMSDVEPTGEPAKAGLVDHKVAVAPFIFIVNKDVTATDLTAAQVAKIFKGEIKNWKEVGGKDAPIAVITRQGGSGTRGTFVAVFMGGKDEIMKEAIVQDSTGKVFDNVAITPGSIGYIDAPYFKADKVSKLKLDGVEYSADAVTGGKWKFWSYEHLYTKGEATGVVKAFIDFMMGKEFQDGNVEKLNFIPVSKMK